GKGIVDHRQQVRVLRLELDHADDTQSTDQLEQDAIVVDEGVVAVLRNRDPPTEIPTVVACPPPLSVVSIPVTHEHIHQASLQEGAGVDTIVEILVKMLEEPIGPGYGDGVMEEGAVPRSLVRMPLEGPEETGELVTELAEARIVGHHHQLGLGVEHPGGIEQPPRHDG